MPLLFESIELKYAALWHWQEGGQAWYITLLRGKFTLQELHEYANKAGPKTIDARAAMSAFGHEDMETLGIELDKTKKNYKMLSQYEWELIKHIAMGFEVKNHVEVVEDSEGEIKAFIL